MEQDKYIGNREKETVSDKKSTPSVNSLTLSFGNAQTRLWITVGAYTGCRCDDMRDFPRTTAIDDDDLGV